MKIAIIGAGIAGLSCAIELERHGIKPVIFEKTKELGDKPGNLIATLRMFYRPVRSPADFFQSKYGINITPEHPINEIVMHTPNKTVTTRGNHGYVFIKGVADSSLEHQLAAHIHSPIEFDTDIKIQDVRYDYDYVVVTTGNGIIASALNIWNFAFMVKCRLAVITGRFNRNRLIFYLNKSYGKNGYGYLLAKNDREAELLLAVPDITFDRLDYYWNEFLITESLRPQIVKCHNFEHVSGYPSTNRFENIYFAGNSGGMIDDFLGFGTLRAMESGILAARSMIYGLDYDRLVRPLKKDVVRMYEYRRMLNVATNKDIDMLVSIIGLPGLKHMIYNNPFYKSKYGLVVPKLITNLRRKDYPFRLDLRK